MKMEKMRTTHFLVWRKDRVCSRADNLSIGCFGLWCEMSTRKRPTYRREAYEQRVVNISTFLHCMYTGARTVVQLNRLDRTFADKTLSSVSTKTSIGFFHSALIVCLSVLSTVCVSEPHRLHRISLCTAVHKETCDPERDGEHEGASQTVI